MKIFFSYPHDGNAKFVDRLKVDLEARGHEVWFDASEIRAGDDWRNAITRGILESQQVVAFLSKWSVRDPGVCLNEIAIALADKGEALVTVLVEPEDKVATPVSITHIQWLRMEDWPLRAQDEGWYRTQLDRLVEAIENPVSAGRDAELETLREALDPLSFYAEIAPHIPGFTGRRWIIERYHAWLGEAGGSRVMRIEGGPGLGKTAVASYLAHSAKSNVLAVHLCQYNKGETRNPHRLVRSLAYQLATRLPDYRARLLRTVAITQSQSMQGKDASSLWSALISEPLSGSGRGNIERQRLAIIIDGLDEANEGGGNEIVNLLVSEIKKLPKWIGVVLTGRPDPELTQRLTGFNALLLTDDDPQNRADLKDYTDQWLAGEVKAGRLTPAQAESAGRALLDRSAGAFLYLTQARMAVGEGMLDLAKPEGFPAGLGGIYLQFFERQFKDLAHYQAKVRPLLELVLASPAPLPVPLAQEILGWGPYDGPTVIRSLGSLVKRGKAHDEETLEPFHASVRDWLADHDTAGEFHVDPNAATFTLAKASWTRYLAKDEKDVFGWHVLPVLLPALTASQQDVLLGTPSEETSAAMQRLAQRLAPALRYFDSAGLWNVQVRRAEQLAEAAPENAGFAHRLKISYDKAGKAQKSLGRSMLALKRYRQGLEVARRLVAAAPDSATFSQSLRISYNKLGSMEKALGRPAAALALFEQSREIAERLVRETPDNHAFARGLRITCNRIGDIHKGQGNAQLALTYYRQGMEIALRMAAAEPGNQTFARGVGIGHHKIADMLRETGNTGEALIQYRLGMEIALRLAADEPGNPAYGRELRMRHNSLGELQRNMENDAAALDHYQQGADIAARLVEEAPENAEFATDLRISLNILGDLQMALGNHAAARTDYERALEIARRLADAAPENNAYARGVAISHKKLGAWHTVAGAADLALAHHRERLRIVDALVDRAPENLAFARDLIDACHVLATSLPGTVALPYWQRLRASLEALETRCALSDSECELLDQARLRLSA
jgi:tetratricopeptide (TPR) repeat protein